jgi:DHA1 family bicyclomycin/chloramphenicol resistance-like MFS transporter
MHLRFLVPILAGLSMLGALSIDAYLPALPAIAHDFAVSQSAVQQTLTVYLIGFAVMMLFYGTLSDSFGRRPIILYSMVCYCASSVGAAWSPSLGWLLFFRLLQGLSAGAGSTVGRAIVVDLYEGAEAQRIMSYISMVFGVAPAFAPILGGWMLSALGWKSIFGFIALFSFLLLFACIAWLPESLAREKRQPFHPGIILRNYLEVGLHGRFMCRSVGAGMTFGGIMVYVTSAPVYLMGLLHLTVKEFGWLFITFILGMTLGSWIASRLSHRMKPNRIILLGYSIMAFSVVLNVTYSACFEPRVPWAVVPHFFYGVGATVCSPAMTVLSLEMFPNVKGLTASLQGFVFMIFFALISGVIDPLIYDSVLHLALAAMVFLLISAILWALGSRGEAEHAPLSDEEDRLAEEAPHL